MQFFVTTLHIVLCVALILIILLQPGKDQGSVFGGGGGGNKMYGPRAGGNLLSRATTVVAVMFMLTSISLAWYSTVRLQEGSNIDDVIDELGNQTISVGEGFGIEAQDDELIYEEDVDNPSDAEAPTEPADLGDTPPVEGADTPEGSPE